MKTKNILLIIAFFTPFISLVSSTSSFNVYNYDLNTPVFTPDGELKQVEYAAEASSHSYPMIIVPCALNGDETLIIMATRNKPQRAQSRIIQMPISHGSQNSGEASLLFGVNGIISDCVSLLQTAREEVQSIQRSYGAPSMSFALVSSTSRPPLPSVKCAKKVALAIADKCQQHSFGGGIRPFGAEIAVCGMDNTGNIAIFVTEPSGSILELTSHANDGGYVIGGESRKREHLKLALQSKETSSTDHNDWKDDDDGSIIREKIHQTINAFVQVYKDEEVDESRGVKTAQEIILDEIDLVMAHSSKGVFRMTGIMLKNVMEKHALSATKD